MWGILFPHFAELMMRLRTSHPALAALVTLCLLGTTTWSQDDAGESKPDELVRQLASSASRGGDRLPEAIRSLARLGAWPEVDRWLTALGGEPDDAKLARAAQLIGTDVLFRISLREELSPASRSVITRLSAVTKTQAESPDRLRQAVSSLQSASVDERLAANRTLMRGGHASIQVIVQEIVGGLDGSSLADALAVLVKLDAGGKDALNQLSIYGDAAARYRALRALVSIDVRLAADSLIASAFADESGNEERAFALQQLPRLSDSISQQDAAEYLAARLQQTRQRAARTPNSPDSFTVWSVAAGNTVKPSQSTRFYQAYLEAYDAAQRVRRIGGLSEDVLKSALIAEMNYRVIVDVDWGDEAQIQSVVQSYGAGPSLLLAALDDAQGADPAACVGLLRLAAYQVGKASPGQDLRWLVASSGTLPSPVVRCCRHPDPRVRYEAATLVAALQQTRPVTPFSGASQVRKTLAEMSRLSDLPIGVLIETRAVIGVQQETVLGDLGVEVVTVETVREAERLIDQGGDIRLVLSKIRLADLPPAELVDRIRRLDRGRNLPIVFFDDGDAHPKSVAAAQLEAVSDRWKAPLTPAVRAIPLAGSPAAFAGVMADVESRRRLPALTGADRTFFRRVAVEALEKLGPAR